MMKAIITGANGAVGSGLRQHLVACGDVPIAWDRAQTPIDDYAKMEAFVLAHKPDVLFHLAIPSQSTGRDNESWWVNYHWTSELAWICRQHKIRFVYISTVMVYSDDAVGPFTPQSTPDAKSGYGYDKLQSEERTFSQNPDAIVARLGWQIGESGGSNNMIDYFEKQMAQHGEVRASRRWYPACSFIPDTAWALRQLIDKSPTVYLVNSNTRWTFYEIANALNEKHGNKWKITPTDDFVYDQRMLDARVSMPELNARLPNLP